MEIACMLGSCQRTHSSNDIPVFLTPSNWVYLSHTGRRLHFTVLSGVTVLTWTLDPLCNSLFNPRRYSVRTLSACDGENPPNTAHASLTFMRFKAVTFHIYNTQRYISVPIPELYGGYLQKGILVHSLHTDTQVAADFTDLNPTLTCPIHLRLLNCEWSHYQTNTSAIVQPNK